jgi:uncharacterized protein
VTGTLINTGAVLVGGAAGLALSRGPSGRLEVYLKRVLGVLVIYVGFSTTWSALGHSGLARIPKQVFIALLALVIGNAIGMALGLQKRLNWVGQFVREKMSSAGEAGSRFSDGFVTCTLLFCVGPMAIVGSIEDGLNGNFRILAIKAVMDGLSAMVFAKTFGPGVLLSALPVLAYQGTITLGARWLSGMKDAHPEMLHAMDATGGLLVVCISVVILEIRKVPLANYLPALAVAPFLAWWWGF